MKRSTKSGKVNVPPVPLTQAIELLHEAFLVTDAQIDLPGPRILYANTAFLRMTGYSREELEGKTPRILQGPKTDRQVIDRLRSCLETGETFEGETVNYRKDGALFLMRWYIEPIRDEEGQITHFFATQRDVTEEREASRQLRTLEKAIRQLTDAVVIFGRDGRVRFVNDTYLSWCNRPTKDVLGTPVWKLIGAPQQKADLVWARKLLRHGQGWRREYAVGGAIEDGEKRFVFVTVSPIRDSAGTVIEFVAVSRDVTERRRLESIAEAHNFHDNLGFVFSGLRHELGNPVNSVKTALRVVTDSVETMPREKLRSYLERIAEEVGRVEYLLRSLRSYSLYDQPRLEAIEMSSFLARFLRLAQPDFENRGVRVEVEVDPDADTVWADPQALHQVLLNLIGNAAAALEYERDGRVWIRAGRQGRHGSLVVQDNGPGIAPDHLPHIFKPFYTTHSGGTGLGLAISRHLLSQMRGSIELTSSESGTVVEILLDRKDPKSYSDEMKR